ncbi:MAG TPA: hypothetical protein VFS58_02035 [Steroidobacteraceae bacterium]|nr:hypothetical protein [Steroidobacteraceae bacterium]
MLLQLARLKPSDATRLLERARCGRGSPSLWMAANYPGSEITAVSNSRTQKLHIESQAKATAGLALPAHGPAPGHAQAGAGARGALPV